MKITKSDLQQIIKEEAVRLYQIEKLEEAKRSIDEHLKLVSEGKKGLTDEELEEIFGLGNVMAGVKNVASAAGKAIGQKAQQIGQKVADTYNQGVTNKKIQDLQKQQADLTAKLNNVNAELAKLQPAQAKAPAGAKAKKPATKPTPR